MSSNSLGPSESTFMEKIKAKLARNGGGCISRGAPLPEKLKPTGAIVYVNVYDMMELNIYTTALGLGVYHSGIEVHGTEYCYGGHPLHYSGIFAMVPKDTESLGPNYTYKITLEIGRTDFTEADVALILEDMGPQFCGDQYHLLHHNCNHFANSFVQILCGNSIPKWINRLASVGAKLPFVERSIPKLWLTPRPLEEVVPLEQSSIHASCPILAPGNICNRRRISPKRSSRVQHLNHSSTLISHLPPSENISASSSHAKMHPVTRTKASLACHSEPISPIKAQPQRAQLLNGQFDFPATVPRPPSSPYSCRSSDHTLPDNQSHRSGSAISCGSPNIPPSSESPRHIRIGQRQSSLNNDESPDYRSNIYNCSGRFASRVLSGLHNLCGVTETHDSIIDNEPELIATNTSPSRMI